MKKNSTYKLIYQILLFALVSSCVEEIPLETESFESILIVEATLTNQSKQHEILLSRSFKFDSIQVQESGASIKVTDDALNTYTFSETEPGTYKSVTSFAAQPNRNYKLSIITSSGKEYGSTEMQLTQATPIDILYVERDFNEDGIEGVSIYVDSYDATGNSNYYRHEYEETYKVISPLYSSRELISKGVQFPILQDDIPNFDSLQEITEFLVELKFREVQEQVCYNTIASNHLILKQTTDLLEDKLDKYRVHFINQFNSKIRHRYSILVRQFVQSRAAFVFYQTLNSLSSSDNVLSETQPGFLEGNVFSKTNSNENVFGFFEVASVDEKRIFFNYEDIFQNETVPPHFIACDEFFAPALITEDFAHNWIGSPLVDAVNEGFQFYNENVDENNSPFLFAPYILVKELCGDCTKLGNNSIPEFWEE